MPHPEQPRPDQPAPEPGIENTLFDAVPGLAQMPGAAVEDHRPRVSVSFIWLVVLSTFGLYLAFIAPVGISLAVRVQQLAPAHAEDLGYILGVGSIAALVSIPLVGVLSDATRSRLGRRRPFILIGSLIGLGSLIVMATAPSIPLLGLGWLLAQLGFGNALAGLVNVQADRLPESQRGRVSGFVGFVQLVAPVAGVGIASGFVGNNVLLFLVPGGVGVLLGLVFVVFSHESDSRSLPAATRTTIGTLLPKYVFSPRKYPAFAWNWLGRFLVYFALSLSTTFTSFYFAQKAGTTVAGVAGLFAIASLAGVGAAAIGALGGGFLSDRLHRRRVFVLVASAVFALGAVILAFAPSIGVVIVGFVVLNIGTGIFSAVDQAIVLDILPERDENAGRFVGINQLALQIGQAIAPLIAPVFLVIGATSDQKNYGLLFILAAVCTLAGGLVIHLRVTGSR
ncbi:MFS transporter [Glaciihabitans sp. UYNi722]|uniref:MFS transporter n=1 Tax=Glaciihabitans sp. UYNi722 TaxID=3156344 RepID=UPI00339566DF